MAVVTICSDFEAPKNSLSLFPYLFAMSLVFWMLSFKPIFSLSSFTFIKRLFSSSSLSAIRLVSSAYQETKMATHSSILAYRIPWTEEPGGLLSMGSHRVGHGWSDLATAAASAYLRLLICLPAILILPCASSIQAFLMMYSAYKLNKQGDNIQPWCTPFLIRNQSFVPCPVLTCR